ncbi:MAG: DUF1428 domain-containing protein [Proteobacteria bacterium]|nr:DUF1428 domain-containing protein [Pseudomonadota bacterium]
MIYVEGFIAAVPAANKAAYIEHATKASSLLKEFGVRRMFESWGDDVPDGKVTDFRKSVQAKDGEVVVFSWFEYPSRQVRDAANEKMSKDPRMADMGSSMPFDGQRMIFSGFESLLDEGPRGRTGYVDGFVVPVLTSKKEAYRQFAGRHAPMFIEYGALRVVEAWGDDVRDGKVTDFKKAVQATGAENVVYSWIEWSSKAARDAGWQKVMADERMKPDHANTPPFDGKRMFYGGFSSILDV